MTPHKVVLLLGPLAVGKMTVGQALCELTGFKLLHAHMVIDLITEFFPFDSKAFLRLVRGILDSLLDELAATGESVVLTYAWKFEDPDNREWVDQLQKGVRARGGELYFAELHASLPTRLQRNRTENRLRHKKVDWATNEYLRDWEAQHQTQSDGSFPYPERHIMLDTEMLSPAEAATRIKLRFEL